MDSLSEFWKKLNAAPEARLVFWFTILAIVIVVSIYVVMRIRGWMMGESPTDSDHLSTFRELRDQGKLDEEEYRRLKKAISPAFFRAEPSSHPKEIPSADNTRDD